MALDNSALAHFNRGIIDKAHLGRVDLKRIALSAEQQTNWIPKPVGQMIFRPGTEYIDSTLSDAEARHLPFIFSIADTAIIEITDGKMRVRVDEQVIERESVSTAITNGTFTSDLTGWTDVDETGATSQFATGGYMDLAGTRFNAAIRRQEVTVIAADRNKEHGLKIVIERGPVTFKCGTSAGGDQYIGEAQLGTGEHSLAFTPTANFHIEFSSRTQYSVLVDSIAVESSGDMTVNVPWKVNDLANLSYDQSADVVFVAADGYQQRRIERRGTGRSWSVVKYETEDGPFRVQNTTTITMTAAALTGDTTLTASRAYFDSDHVGALFKLISRGQKVETAVTGEGQFTDSIRVVGVGTGRVFDLDITGTWVATVTLQRSFDDESSWTDVNTYTTNQNTPINDGLDNEIVFYRLGVDTGDFTSGTATCTLEWSGGGITGTCRVTGFTSSTVVDIAVLNHIGQVTATDQWSEGVWSELRGFPTVTTFYEGRLWWLGNDYIIGSVSDAFESFDDEVEGESGPIVRTIGSGPVANIAWVLAAQRLLVGAEDSERSIRSTTLDELVTPTNFNIKQASTQGSARVSAVKIDTEAVFVVRSGIKAFVLKFDLTSNDYQGTDLFLLAPEIGDPGIVQIAIQRQPDTRLHFLRSDGTVVIMLLDLVEDLKAIVEVEVADTAAGKGEVEDIFIMPGNLEDVVYYCVRWVIDGEVKRYLTKWALESECIGSDTYSCNADAFAMFINNPASATVSGLEHLEGESVVVWSDGVALKDPSGNIATFTVASGSITLTDEGSSFSASQGIVGLAHRARFKSGKLPYAVSLSTVLGQQQRISKIGLICTNTHNQGLKFGRDFDNMDNLPKEIDGGTVDDDDVHSFLDIPQVIFPGETTTKARVCLEANAPRPATVVAASLGLATFEQSP